MYDSHVNSPAKQSSTNTSTVCALMYYTVVCVFHNFWEIVPSILYWSTFWGILQRVHTYRFPPFGNPKKHSAFWELQKD